MTADQRLIVRLEQVSKAVDSDELHAAFSMLDEILAEILPSSARESLRQGQSRASAMTNLKRSTPAAAAG